MVMTLFMALGEEDLVCSLLEDLIVLAGVETGVLKVQFGIVFESMVSFLHDEDWQLRHAAITVIGIISEGCSKEIVICSKDMEQLVGAIVELIHDKHPRVQWATITCNWSTIKVSRPAFSRAISSAAPSSFNRKRNDNGERSGSGSLASLAISSQEDSAYIYDSVPYLQKVILVITTEDNSRMLLAKSLECITLTTMAVGNLAILGYVEKVTAALISLQETHMEEEDPMRCLLLQAWGRLRDKGRAAFVELMVVSALVQILQLKYSEEKGLPVIGCGKSPAQKISDTIIPALLDALTKESKVQIQATLMEALNESIQINNSLSSVFLPLSLIVFALKYLLTDSGNDRTAKRRIVVQLFRDIAEQCQEEVYYHKNPDVPQIVATAIGICAELGADSLDLILGIIFNHLKTVMEHQMPKAGQHREHETAKPAETCWPFGSYIPNIIAIFAEVYGQGTIWPQKLRRIVNLLKKFQRELQPPFLSENI
ncbi:hypothetical protein HAX54_023662 [Datura stramonium]|uniref:Uncharacterized protein n=1 Tax=Datura stramonium TaxID=4076 RepID=A0ABS8UXC3_DATST|nr:hypothetical protein [Datura stramonium]